MRRLALVLTMLANPAVAQDKPLSAIDWLSDSVRSPAAPPQSPPGYNRPTGGEAPVAGQVPTHQVQVTALDGAGPRLIGTRLPSDSNFPADLWRASSVDSVETAIQATSRSPIPALQDLVRHLLLTRAHGPLGADAERFALMRVDHLLEIGALEDAQALLDAAGVTQPNLFRRYFDATLLLGHEDDACAIMEVTPSVAPTFAARIFCLARGGDWSAAALTLGTARALGELDPVEEALLSRYLDPDLYEGEPIPRQDGIPSPLVFRLREAIGAPVPTSRLPLAFRVADLRHHMGWKFQLDAAEALAAAGVLAPSHLLRIYLAGRPSASGGVWDRVAAVQALNSALQDRDAQAIAATLPPAWRAAQSAQLEVAFAAIWGERLAALELSAEAATLAHDIRMLAPGYEGAATLDAVADAIARGEVPQLPQSASIRARAVADAFVSEPEADAKLKELMDQKRIGEALLGAIALFETGRYGDPASVRDALIQLRVLGQDDVARRAAIQYLLLGDAA